MQLQRDSHLKAKELVRLKRQQFEKYTQTRDEKRKQINAAAAATATTADAIVEKNNPYQLQVAIYNKIDEADTMLEKMCSSPAASKETGDSEVSNTSKRSKGELLLMEQLRTVNQQLHLHVYELMSQLDESNKEQQGLRELIKCLEKKVAINPSNPNNHLVDLVATPTADDVNADNVLADSCATLSLVPPIIITPKPPSARNTYSELPPLDLPKFDFDDEAK